MKNIMYIKHDDGRAELFICPCQKCRVMDYDEPIPRFYSWIHAVDNGWHFTNDIKYYPPDQKCVADVPSVGIAQQITKNMKL